MRRIAWMKRERKDGSRNVVDVRGEEKGVCLVGGGREGRNRL